MTQKTIESIVEYSTGGADSAVTTVQYYDDGVKIRSYLSPFDTDWSGKEPITLTLSFSHSDFGKLLDLLLDRSKSHRKIATTCSERNKKCR